MKIAYIAYANTNEKTGVGKKLLNQLKELNSKKNVTCKLFLISNQTNVANEKIKLIRYKTKNIFIKNLMAVKNLKQSLKTFRPDIIYLRYPLFRPMLKKAFYSKAKIVMEVNTNIFSELIRNKQYFKFITEKLFGKSLMNVSDAIVSVTPELSEFYRNYLKNNEINFFNLGNAVEMTDSIKNINHELNEKEIHLLFMGQGTTWHGLDRVIDMMKRRKPQNLFLHWCGVKNYEFKNEYLKDHIILEGFIDNSDKLKLFKKIDLAISSLGLHRINMNQGSPLKTREYLAYGIPTLIGYKDPYISQENKFIFSVDSTDEPIDFKSIKNYVNYIRKNTEIKKMAQEYTEKNLTYNIQSEELLEIFRSL